MIEIPRKGLRVLVCPVFQGSGHWLNVIPEGQCYYKNSKGICGFSPDPRKRKICDAKAYTLKPEVKP